MQKTETVTFVVQILRRQLDTFTPIPNETNSTIVFVTSRSKEACALLGETYKVYV